MCSLQFLNRLQLVEPSLEERVSNLLAAQLWVQISELNHAVDLPGRFRIAEQATAAGRGFLA